MTCIKVFYDAERGDWLEALDRQVQDTLDKLSYRPDLVLCLPKEDKQGPCYPAKWNQK